MRGPTGEDSGHARGREGAHRRGAERTIVHRIEAASAAGIGPKVRKEQPVLDNLGQAYQRLERI
jgi:hypothetical protein